MLNTNIDFSLYVCIILCLLQRKDYFLKAVLHFPWFYLRTFCTKFKLGSGKRVGLHVTFYWLEDFICRENSFLPYIMDELSNELNKLLLTQLHSELVSYGAHVVLTGL
jgi:hypothetical protein